MRRWVARGFWILFAAPFVLWAALPWPVAYRWANPHATAVMRYRLAQARAEGDTLELRQQWVPLAEISAQMVRAVLASEDGRFRSHHGIDWIGLGEELHYDGEEPFSWKDSED